MKLFLSLYVLLASQQAEAKRVTVPIDIGVGPAAQIWTGPLAQDQLVHTGLSISAAAVLDQQFLKQNRKLIPQQYRRQITQMNEIRIGHLLVPDTLIISPKVKNTGMYGITWRPLTLSIPLIDSGIRVDTSADLLFTYTYIHSDLENLGTTHFVRPGLGLSGAIEFPLGGRFRASLYWRSGLYVPQQIGETLDELGPVDEGNLSQSIWHVGQGAIRLHYRFPFTTNI
ncbi:MAG: hypothetical protein VXW32_05295 [Myxococcota bacterium]|nr:hypothetical protein [Myxococcota bacterium]